MTGSASDGGDTPHGNGLPSGQGYGGRGSITSGQRSTGVAALDGERLAPAEAPCGWRRIHYAGPAGRTQFTREQQEKAVSIERLHKGPRMSQVVKHGGLVYLAGQVAQGAPGSSVAEQTQDILDRIDQLLGEAGTSKSKILTATIWLANIGTFGEMNEVWDAWIDLGNPPARACVESKLAAPQYTVEIQVVAAA